MASPVSCHLILSHLSQGAEETGEGAGIVSLECVTNTCGLHSWEWLIASLIIMTKPRMSQAL